MDSETQRADRTRAAKRWFDEHWRHGPCPVCGAEDWSFYPRLGQISNLGFAGRIIPLLLLGCDTCGYVVAVNAVTAGVISSPEDQQDAELVAPNFSDESEKLAGSE